MKNSLLALIPGCTLALSLAACTPQPPTTSVETAPAAPVETTVVIDGKAWTCEQLTAPASYSSGADECGPLTQQAFDNYKENINRYVRSGELGPFDDDKQFIYEEAVFAGLVACATMLDKKDSNDYIDAMLREEPYKTRLTERSKYVPSWVAAKKHLCTDLEQITVDTGHQTSGDRRVE